jgi:hypothetical protein
LTPAGSRDRGRWGGRALLIVRGPALEVLAVRASSEMQAVPIAQDKRPPRKSYKYYRNSIEKERLLR